MLNTKEVSREEARAAAITCGDQLNTLFSANAWAIYTEAFAKLERKRKKAMRDFANARPVRLSA